MFKAPIRKLVMFRLHEDRKNFMRVGVFTEKDNNIFDSKTREIFYADQVEYVTVMSETL